MRCTSSDLIIVATAPLNRKTLVAGRRVPKGQKTVKVELIDCPHGAPFVEALRERAEARRAQDRAHRGMQERQVAEAVMQRIVADRGLGVDIAFLRQPGNRGLLVAELVDELERDALA